MTAGYRVLPGPEAYLPPSAAMMGVVQAEPGRSLVEGTIVPEEEAIALAARKLIEARVPAIFPGPLVLWKWCDRASLEARAVKILAESIPARVLPMADYRPKYPKINAEVEINPNHPNLTIWHNKIDVCVFVGVHCHQANIALKIIRAGTSCYTIALCTFSGDDEANITIRDLTAQKILRLAQTITSLKSKPPVSSHETGEKPTKSKSKAEGQKRAKTHH